MYGVRGVQVANYLVLLLYLIVALLLAALRVIRNNGLVWLEILTNSLVDGRLSQLVIVRRFHFDHVFQV